MSGATLMETGDDQALSFDELLPGTQLQDGHFVISSFLNAGGFGTTYLANDKDGNTVVIKECFPSAICRRSGLTVLPRSPSHQNDLQMAVRSFLDEARSLAKVSHPNIVGLREAFEENATAYMAMEYIEGGDMFTVLEDENRKFTPTDLRQLLIDLLRAVSFVHRAGILHRDIAPDNVLIRADGSPVLIDFGAARESATRKSRLLTAMHSVKDGYSPQEFYVAGSAQAPSGDLYSLGATIYHIIYGEPPPNSQIRLAAVARGSADPYVPLAGREIGYPQPFLAAIDASLSIFPDDRPQSADEWLGRIEEIEVPEPAVIPVAAVLPPVRRANAPSKRLAVMARRGRFLNEFLRGVATACVVFFFGTMLISNLGRPEPTVIRTADNAAPASPVAVEDASALPPAAAVSEEKPAGKGQEINPAETANRP